MSALLLERSFSDFKSFVAALIGNFGRILSQSAGFRPIEQIHIDIIHPPQYGACILGLVCVSVYFQTVGGIDVVSLGVGSNVVLCCGPGSCSAWFYKKN